MVRNHDQGRGGENGNRHHRSGQRDSYRPTWDSGANQNNPFESHGQRHRSSSNPAHGHRDDYQGNRHNGSGYHGSNYNPNYRGKHYNPDYQPRNHNHSHNRNHDRSHDRSHDRNYDRHHNRDHNDNPSSLSRGPRGIDQQRGHGNGSTWGYKGNRDNRGYGSSHRGRGGHDFEDDEGDAFICDCSGPNMCHIRLINEFDELRRNYRRIMAIASQIGLEHPTFATRAGELLQLWDDCEQNTVS